MDRTTFHELLGEYLDDYVDKDVNGFYGVTLYFYGQSPSDPSIGTMSLMLSKTDPELVIFYPDGSPSSKIDLSDPLFLEKTKEIVDGVAKRLMQNKHFG